MTIIQNIHEKYQQSLNLALQKCIPLTATPVEFILCIPTVSQHEYGSHSETPIMDIYEKFLSYPPTAQSKPVELRKIIMQVANNNPGIGVLTEGLRWGGSTVT